MDDLDFLHQSYESRIGEGTALPKVVLVEDDNSFGSSIKKYLEKSLGVEVLFYSSPRECLDSLDEQLKQLSSENTGEGQKKLSPFCLVTDISFQNESNGDGLLLIDLLKERGHQFSCLVMTGFASIETAITATKKGVYHYLTKPFELDILADLVKSACIEKLGVSPHSFATKQTAQNQKKVSVETPDTEESVETSPKKYRIERPTEETTFCGMIGRSKYMQDVFERIQKVATSDSTILIGGPSGTGKELVAKAIHRLSLRKNETMVSVNCGAIPSELLESELFGHEKGAFTGAISQRKGRFEMADNGTIFLDEIGDMPLLLQVKLLRVLQGRVIERVGSTEQTPVNVRIITATHRDLEQAVTEGDFREDLYYRLNVIPVKVPALQKRKEDIPLLIGHFLERFVSADGRNDIEFDDEALELLMNYEWPGNVRELENLVERLVILKGGSYIKAHDLPPKLLQGQVNVPQGGGFFDLPDEGIDLKRTLGEIEDSLIVQALERTYGNKNQASKLLNLNRTTLIEKMKKRGITHQDLSPNQNSSPTEKRV